MQGHRLDRVIWEALSTRQRSLAEGNGSARRYQAAVAPFAATLDDTVRSYQDLSALVTPEHRAALVTVTQPGAPPGLAVIRRDLVDQMVLDRPSAAPPSSTLARLGVADIPAMMALAEVTHPGPFGLRTIEMGTYLGVKADGRLIAMTGERMQIDGHTEVSAVCVDPSHRGRGLAADLINAVASGIFARGDVPFLHVFSSNTAAIELYLKLGFVRRRQLHLTVMAKVL